MPNRRFKFIDSTPDFKIIRSKIFNLSNDHFLNSNFHICQFNQLQAKKDRFCECKNIRRIRDRVVNGTIVYQLDLRSVACLLKRYTEKTNLTTIVKTVS